MLTKPKTQAACKQHTHLHSLFSLFSIWLFTCFVLTAICPLLLLSVSDTDFVPSRKKCLGFFLAPSCTLLPGHWHIQWINLIARLLPGAPQSWHSKSTPKERRFCCVTHLKKRIYLFPIFKYIFIHRICMQINSTIKYVYKYIYTHI